MERHAVGCPLVDVACEAKHEGIHRVSGYRHGGISLAAGTISSRASAIVNDRRQAAGRDAGSDEGVENRGSAWTAIGRIELSAERLASDDEDILPDKGEMFVNVRRRRGQEDSG